VKNPNIEIQYMPSYPTLPKNMKKGVGMTSVVVGDICNNCVKKNCEIIQKFRVGKVEKRSTMCAHPSTGEN